MGEVNSEKEFKKRRVEQMEDFAKLSAPQLFCE